MRGLQSCTGEQLSDDPSPGFVGRTIPVGEGAAAQVATNAFGPPALDGFGLPQQVADGGIAADEHQSLAKQFGLEHIAKAFEAFLGEVGGAKKGNGLA